MSDKKKDFLKKEGILNPNPERVLCPKFKSVDFFDPLDLPQVRYEMLRSARIGNASVAEACRQFGFSREYFYRLERSFKERGYVSLLGSRKGRRPVVAPEPGNRELYRPPQNVGTRSVRREASGGDLPAVQGGVLPPNGRENRGAARTRKKRGPRVSALTIGDAACAHPRFAEEADKAQSLYEKARKAALDGRFRVPENLSGTLKKPRGRRHFHRSRTRRSFDVG